MNTLADILAFNREYPSPHVAASDRGSWVIGVVLAALFLLATVGAWAGNAVQSVPHALTATHEIR